MKKLNYGMVGGGPESFIGDAHRKAMNIDAQTVLTAGCFSRTMEKCLQTGLKRQLQRQFRYCRKFLKSMKAIRG